MILKQTERILVFAPHPDDETLAVGGLLAEAFHRGLPVRVVYLTSGDHNPWAQRFVERRWKIRGSDRQRWAQIREKEALEALQVLGGSPECAAFLR
jgi:LmbE family N-acetylglucosaminyl deacetylase